MIKKLLYYLTIPLLILLIVSCDTTPPDDDNPPPLTKGLCTIEVNGQSKWIALEFDSLHETNFGLETPFDVEFNPVKDSTDLMGNPLFNIKLGDKVDDYLGYRPDKFNAPDLPIWIFGNQLKAASFLIDGVNAYLYFNQQIIEDGNIKFLTSKVWLKSLDCEGAGIEPDSFKFVFNKTID